MAFYGNNEKNELLEENKERKSSPNRSFSGLFNESRYSHIVNIETIENNCIIHHFENEFFCIDHLVYLCQVCLGEKKKIHEQCTMTNAKNIDFPQIIENIYQDFKEFYATNYKKLENFIEILKMLEERKKSLNFQIIINSIKDQNIVPKLMVLEEKKEKILEIAHIIFEKYLERLSGLHNTRIDIMEKTKKILKTVKENYENYVISKANEKEQNEIFQIFLKNNKILINLKQESQNNEFNRLFEIMFSNEKSIVCISIFNTIFDHLSKIYSKLETDSF